MLYQQQRIEIIIRKDDTASIQGAKEKSADEVSEEQSSSTSSAMPLTQSSNARSRFLRVNMTHAFAVAKQGVNAFMNYAVQGIGDKYGDQALQQNIQRQVEIFQDTTNMASSVAIGLTYGASGGPLGMLIGATLGALSNGISLYTKYETREREFNYKQFKENNAIEYQRARASINLTTGRLR